MAGESTMHQRINITLPDDTVRLLDRVAPKGDRSRYIDRAVRELAKRARKVQLRRELKEGYLRENETNRQLAEEWFLLDEEAWATAEKE
jgi:CopG family transcriptional regulator/antitoxin EndoAI